MRQSPARTKVTAAGAASTVFLMGKPEWPVEEFNTYLEGLMEREGIRDREELARVSGVNSSILSKWKRGVTQPSRENLTKLATALKVSPGLLWIAAGLATSADLDLAEAPDFRVFPREVQALIDLLAHPKLPQDERDELLVGVGLLVSGAQARLDQAARPNRAPRVNRLA